MIDYKEFINEMATKSDMKVGDYVYCGGNFKNVETPTKGKYAKIIDREIRPIAWDYPTEFFTLEFDEPLISMTMKKNGHYSERKESNTIEISSRQLKLLNVIPKEEYDEFKNSGLMSYEATNIFKNILKTIEFKVESNFLDISYFDIDIEKDDVVSFLPSNKLEKSVELKEDPYKSKFRQVSKIGRIFKKLNDGLTDSQIENFVHEYKALWSTIMKNSENRLQVVNGDKISYWYDGKKYLPGKGTLNRSCMRYASIVKFYDKHPDKIAMAILLNSDDKLLARALIWKLDEPKGVIYMDRIYSVKSMYGKILLNYAHKNNMKTRAEGWNVKNRMEIKIKHNDYLPYLDSFRYDYNKKLFINK